jgi:membrane protease YdiL (CAAX protease family)
MTIGRRNVQAFLLITFSWSWTLWLLARSIEDRSVGSDNTSGYLIFAGSFGPLIGSLGCSFLAGGGTEIARLLKRLLPIRSNWRSLLLACYVFIPAVALLAVVYGRGNLTAVASNIGLMIFLPLVALFSIATGPVGEEFGWRGVLLPYFLERIPAAQASTYVGAVWALWHAPLWMFADFRSGLSVQTFVPIYVLSILAVSFVFTWLHLRSGGNITVAILAHGAFNSSILPLEALREENIFTQSTAWPFVIATSTTGLFALSRLVRRREVPNL